MPVPDLFQRKHGRLRNKCHLPSTKPQHLCSHAMACATRPQIHIVLPPKASTSTLLRKNMHESRSTLTGTLLSLHISPRYLFHPAHLEQMGPPSSDRIPFVLVANLTTHRSSSDGTCKQTVRKPYQRYKMNLDDCICDRASSSLPSCPSAASRISCSPLRTSLA